MGTDVSAAAVDKCVGAVVGAGDVGGGAAAGANVDGGRGADAGGGAAGGQGRGLGERRIWKNTRGPCTHGSKTVIQSISADTHRQASVCREPQAAFIWCANNIPAASLPHNHRH